MDSSDSHQAATAAPVWFPTPDYVGGSNLERLANALNIAIDPRDPAPGYAALYRRSIEDPDAFWRATLEDMGVEWFTPYTKVVDTSGGVQWPSWFVGGKLNLVHNAVHRHARGERAAQPAIIWEGEDGAIVTLTFAELGCEVARAANALRKLGVAVGDRVGIFL